MKKINENTKVTLTLKQLRELVKESQSAPRITPIPDLDHILTIKQWRKTLSKADPDSQLHICWTDWSNGGYYCCDVHYSDAVHAILIEQTSNKSRGGPTVEEILQILDQYPDDTPIYTHWKAHKGCFYRINSVCGDEVEVHGMYFSGEDKKRHRNWNVDRQVDLLPNRRGAYRLPGEEQSDLDDEIYRLM